MQDNAGVLEDGDPALARPTEESGSDMAFCRVCEARVVPKNDAPGNPRCPLCDTPLEEEQLSSK